MVAPSTLSLKPKALGSSLNFLFPLLPPRHPIPAHQQVLPPNTSWIRHLLSHSTATTLVQITIISHLEFALFFLMDPLLLPYNTFSHKDQTRLSILLLKISPMLSLCLEENPKARDHLAPDYLSWPHHHLSSPPCILCSSHTVQTQKTKHELFLSLGGSACCSLCLEHSALRSLHVWLLPITWISTRMSPPQNGLFSAVFSASRRIIPGTQTANIYGGVNEWRANTTGPFCMGWQPPHPK